VKQNTTGVDAVLGVKWLLPTVGNVTEIRSKFMRFAAGVVNDIYVDCVMSKFETLTQARKLPVAVQNILGRKLMEDADSDTVDSVYFLSMELCSSLKR
jgi:hypothetical protein